jgi:PAS domain S-box-containing protein
MSEAGQDWAGLGATAARDAGLASAAAGGALLLWDAETGRPGFADAGARALLGADALSANLPAATRQRLTLLAGGLAPRDGVRLERLRLTAGFSASMITCGCKLLETETGGFVLVIAIPATEMRRLGIVVPVTAEPVTEAVAPAPEPAAVVEAPSPKPRRTMVRFLWTSDASGRLASVSPDIAELTGPDAAAALPGRSFAELIGRNLIDRDGGLSQRFEAGATWSGHRVLWRTDTAGEGARVEVSGVPVLDAARQISGFRGFGLARLTEREPFTIADAAQAEHEPEADAAPVAEDVALAAEQADLPAVETTPEQGEPPALERREIETAQAHLVESEPAPSAGIDAPAQDAGEPATLTAFRHPDDGDAFDEITPEEEAELAAELEAEDAESAARVAALRLEGDARTSQLDEPEPIDASEVATSEQTGMPGDDDISQLPAVPAEPVATAPTPIPGANIVPLRNGHLTSVRPVLEPSKPNLSSAERNAFREIAKALGARIAGEDEAGPRLPPVAPLRLKETEEQRKAPARAPQDEPPAATPADVAPAPAAVEETAAQEATRLRLPNSHADVLDRLPIAVLVNRGDEALYANRTLLDLLDYADLDDLAAGGSVSRLIKEASRTDGGPMILIDRRGHLVSVDAVLSSLSWQGEPATLMAFRHPDGGGEVKVMTPEEAGDAELAAEFEAEDTESAARVEALRLDVDVRESRISELVAMLDTATDGVVTVDERGRILSLNKTAEALFGYDQREVTGELFTLLFAAESHAPALDYLEGLRGGGVASVMNDGREVVGRVRQGGKIPLFMTMGQIAEAPERRFCAVLRDITAWKKTEGELVEARKAAEKASAQKSDVLAKISHEIRTPLNAIIGFAEVMAEERFGPIANERYKEYLRDIHQSGGYVISLVNDLLDLAKIEAGKLDLDFVSVNLNEIALSTVALLQPEANRGRVVLRSGLAPKLPPVVADQRSIRQIAINLLSNAVKFTDAGGQVIVSTALGDQGEAILRVRDTGIGMDDDEIALALEPFRQVPTTRRAGGTGLGLPLTKALVEANRAAMSITSVKKEGTLIEITFPPQRVLAG